MTATFAQPDYTTDTGTTYPLNIDAAVKVMSRIAASFAAHEQSTPDMTVRVDAGVILDGTTLTEVTAQDTGTITAPSGDPRIDRVVIDASTGAVSVITGSEAASPSAPAITSGKLPIAQVSLSVGQSTIQNADITDERVLYLTGAVDALTSSDIGSTVQAYDADTAKTDTAQSFTAPQRADQSTVTDGTLDLDTAQNFVYTPSGADTLEFSNEAAGQSGLIFLTNGSNHTITLGAEITAPDGMASAISATGEFVLTYAVEASGGGADTVKMTYATVV